MAFRHFKHFDFHLLIHFFLFPSLWPCLSLWCSFSEELSLNVLVSDEEDNESLGSELTKSSELVSLSVSENKSESVTLDLGKGKYRLNWMGVCPKGGPLEVQVSRWTPGFQGISKECPLSNRAKTKRDSATEDYDLVYLRELSSRPKLSRSTRTALVCIMETDCTQIRLCQFRKRKRAVWTQKWNSIHERRG